jgi:hypothetical protein
MRTIPPEKEPGSIRLRSGRSPVSIPMLSELLEIGLAVGPEDAVPRQGSSLTANHTVVAVGNSSNPNGLVQFGYDTLANPSGDLLMISYGLIMPHQASL